jgi:hypothetical protein
MATPGATSAEMMTPQPHRSSPSAMTGTAASDAGVANPNRAPEAQRMPGTGEPNAGDGKVH